MLQESTIPRYEVGARRNSLLLYHRLSAPGLASPVRTFLIIIVNPDGRWNLEVEITGFRHWMQIFPGFKARLRELFSIGWLCESGGFAPNTALVNGILRLNLRRAPAGPRRRRVRFTEPKSEIYLMFLLRHDTTSTHMGLPRLWMAHLSSLSSWKS